MSKKLRITKITLETKGGKPVDLTIDEARELHAQLNEMFGSKVVIGPSRPVYIPYYRPYWYTYGPSVGSPTTTSLQYRGESGMSITCQADQANGGGDE